MHWEPDEVLVLSATLTRDATDAATRVRLAGHDPVRLPSEDGGPREAAVEQLGACLAAARAALPHALLQASIRTPGPGGLTVPHGDVIAVLDAFRRAGIDDVVFEGRPPPIPAPRD